MRSLVVSPIVVLCAVSITWACAPQDSGRAAEVAFDNEEIFDLAKLTALGAENVSYYIESQEKDEMFPSDRPVVVYRSHFDERVMVKVGFSPSVYDWRSVLLVLPEKMDAEAFDFPAAMQEELQWLMQLGLIDGLGEDLIPTITQDLVPGARFFTREMILSYQNCFAPEECVRCTGAAAYTQLPPESLMRETAAEKGWWGKIKASFR